MWTNVALHRRDHTGFIVVWVPCHQEPEPRGANDADRSATAVESTRRLHLVEVADQDRCTPGALQHRCQRCQRTAHVLIARGTGLTAKKCHERVNNQEGRIVLHNGTFDSGEIAWQRDRVFYSIDRLNSRHDKYVIEVSICRAQTRCDGVCRAILCTENDNAAGAQGWTTRQGITAGRSRSDF